MSFVDKIKNEFKKNKGVRIGHTAVVSRKVHTINPDCPEKVSIMMNSDAGEVFYNRLTRNEIIHIDLFHEIKTFDLKHMADYVKESLINNSLGHLIDFIDIQTGSGGGKLTGNLSYGKTESLINNHLNHVHLAALISDDELSSLLILISSIEEALNNQNVELRKVEYIKHEIGNKNIDMSTYTTDSDSNLKQDQRTQSQSNFRNAIEIIEHFGSIKEIEELFDDIRRVQKDPQSAKDLKKKSSNYEDMLSYCEKRKLLRKSYGIHLLTKDGESFREFIKINRKELESILKQNIKKYSKISNYNSLEIVHNYRTALKCQKGPGISVPFDNKELAQELDVIETVKNAVVRSCFQKKELQVEEQDIIAIKRIPKPQQDICLIIDASASMAGSRLRNAKYLAKHLILKPYTRISVLAFQERKVSLNVPFTRNYDLFEEGINSITSTGLTPLALALDKGLLYMKTKYLKNPLIMLITDGIPTVSLWSADPIKDAINAAEKIAKNKINFCCIGLQPNKDCLVKISEAAKGKLFILDELSREALVEIVNKDSQFF